MKSRVELRVDNKISPWVDVIKSKVKPLNPAAEPFTPANNANISHPPITNTLFAPATKFAEEFKDQLQASCKLNC